jgi:hypothetical protein
LCSGRRREEGSNKEEAKEKEAADWQAVNPQLLLLFAERDERRANRAFLLRDVG